MPSTQYLFLFTIAPVQSFIAQARKTRDLYAGSAIISDLINVAMQESEKCGEIIFPFSVSESKPNRFLAKIQTVKIQTDKNTEGDIQKFCEMVEEETRKKWIQLSAKAFKAAKLSCHLQRFDENLICVLPFKSCIDDIEKVSSIAAHQIAEFPDIYWAAIPYENVKDYQAKHEELNRLLGAVKNVRKFSQLCEPAGRKCSMDGERNAIFYRAGENKKRPAFMDWDQGQYEGEIHEIKDTEVAFALTPKEALSAVSLVKRFYKRQGIDAFPSTAQIALMNIPKEILEKKYKTYFYGEEVDYQLFYDENLTEKNLNKQEIKIKNNYSLEEIRKVFNNLNKEKKTKYYAILLFDGDSFGKLWSGDILKSEEGKQVDLEGFQKRLAQHLHLFAEEAKVYLDDGKGRTVYTGGDDFLGFVNLSHLFDVMKTLREKFSESVCKPFKDELKEDETITFTAGVAIAHYKAPLGEVLKRAHAVEETAKKRFEGDGKDAFGIAVIKSSGETLETYFKWQEKNTEAWTTKAINEIVSARNQKKVSNKFLKSIDREFRPLFEYNREEKRSWIDNKFDEHLERELKRLLMRSKNTSKIGLEELDHLYNSINCLKSCSKNKEGNIDAENFFSALHIAEFIKRQISDDDYNG